MNLHKMKVRVRKIFFRVRTAPHRTTQINYFSARHRTALGAEGARGCAGAEMMISNNSACMLEKLYLIDMR